MVSTAVDTARDVVKLFRRNVAGKQRDEAATLLLCKSDAALEALLVFRTNAARTPALDEKDAVLEKHNQATMLCFPLDLLGDCFVCELS